MNHLNKKEEQDFQNILALITDSRKNMINAINQQLIVLYWNIGQCLSDKCQLEGWGNRTITDLSNFIRKTEPNSRGFSSQNLWRMKQFYEAYCQNEKLSPLVREVSWTNNMIIIGQAKTDEEREFYLRLAAKENYSKRELQRQLSSGLYERAMLSKENISPAAKEIYPQINSHIRDYYALEFLGLKDNFTEHKFKKAILGNMKKFILEFGKDFLFVKEEFKLQVGNSDYFIDLLFYHRGLNCLIALELKVGVFKPEHMGKMDFYLGALDKYVKKPHENPSIGIIMCRTKDENIVEISLNRSTSPTVISQYETQLIDKEILRAKLDEFFDMEKG